MKKIYFSIPHSLISLFIQVKKDLELKGYVITNNFQEHELNPYSSEIVSTTNNQIYNSDLVIAVDVHEPAVAFEIGYAAGLSKKIIIMEREETEIPTILKDFYYLRWKSSMFLAEEIDYFIRIQFKSSTRSES